VLVLKKLGDDLLPELMAALRFLRDGEGMRCVVERDVYDRLSTEDGFGFVETFYATDAHRVADAVDFVICLGGDGVILHAASLFNNSAAPPIISFNLGSLGFLTSHKFDNFEADIRGLMYGDGLMNGAAAMRAATAEHGLTSADAATACALPPAQACTSRCACGCSASCGAATGARRPSSMMF
jgi:NAD kinase